MKGQICILPVENTSRSDGGGHAQIPQIGVVPVVGVVQAVVQARLAPTGPGQNRQSFIHSFTLASLQTLALLL